MYSARLIFPFCPCVGTAGDSLRFHKNEPFSTKDREHAPRKWNCAKSYKGAWWYKACHTSNLNGLYLNGYSSSYATGMVWDSWRGMFYSVKKSEMKIRPTR